jgi:hypothetical protein
VNREPRGIDFTCVAATAVVADTGAAHPPST